MIDAVLIALGTSLATAFGSWVFFIRKHKAEAVGTEKINDRTEIENYKLIAQEWREAAQQWKDLADEYQVKLIENSRRVEAFLARFEANDKELAANKKEIEGLKALLAKANRRIAELEKWEKSTK